MFGLVAACGVTSAPAIGVESKAGKGTVASDCLHTRTASIGGGTIHIDFDPTQFTSGAGPICRWIELAATAVSNYFGRFPVARVNLVLRADDKNGVHGGTTYGDADGASRIVVSVGRGIRQDQLDGDWVLTHEMVHLAVPSVPRESHWLEEGIATYVEPIARVQLGQLEAKRIWADMLQGMPKGLPKSGDRGLERTPTWGRTYWGGGLFCLLADVAIRERTRNRMSLRDALRGVQDAGGSIEQDWPVDRVLGAGDKATGQSVLAELYQKMGREPGIDELDSLWRRLGVSTDGGTVKFDDSAPLAAIRRAITAPARE